MMRQWCRNISVLALAVCALFVAGSAYAGAKDCDANYVLDNAGTIATGWKSLGQVSGLLANKKKLCKEKAIASCGYAKEKLTTYAPVGSANFNAICNAGKLCVYFDTRVEDKKNSKDGNCCTPVGCKKSPVVCTCPAGSIYDSNALNSGYAYCKKQSPCAIPPGAPNTALGNYGYIYNGILWVNTGVKPTCTGGAWIGY